jgi:hypothetical protein
MDGTTRVKFGTTSIANGGLIDITDQLDTADLLKKFGKADLVGRMLEMRQREYKRVYANFIIGMRNTGNLKYVREIFFTILGKKEADFATRDLESKLKVIFCFLPKKETSKLERHGYGHVQPSQAIGHLKPRLNFPFPVDTIITYHQNFPFTKNISGILKYLTGLVLIALIIFVNDLNDTLYSFLGQCTTKVIFLDIEKCLEYPMVDLND